MYKFLLFAAAAAVLAYAADPAGFNIWHSAELKGFDKSLAPKMSAQKVAAQSLAKYGSYSTEIAHREGSGQAELHEKVADVFVAQSGEATLVVGGTMPGAKTTEPGQRRGPSIEGGTKHKLAPGDIVHIPANTPHQLLLEPGAKFTYFVLKVNSK